MQGERAFHKQQSKARSGKICTFFPTQAASQKRANSCSISHIAILTRNSTNFAYTVGTVPITRGKHLKQGEHVNISVLKVGRLGRLVPA